jgi:thiol-disulfide isomerase/thioredoxin
VQLSVAGTSVSTAQLEHIISKVSAMALDDDRDIGKALMKEVRMFNYAPPGGIGIILNRCCWNIGKERVEMTKIEVFGTGCTKCKKLERLAQQAVLELGLDIEVVKIENHQGDPGQGHLHDACPLHRWRTEGDGPGAERRRDQGDACEEMSRKITFWP